MQKKNVRLSNYNEKTETDSYNSIRTDLALEAHEIKKKETNSASNINGVEIKNINKGKIEINRVKILNEEGAKALSKPLGNYITIEIPSLNNDSQSVYEEACSTTAKELSNIINISEKSTVLVVGLGNRHITPDALGPFVTEKLMITRHLLKYVPEEIDDNIRPVCAISPGVLGITGVETGEIVKGVVDKIHPDLIIAIDSLAARKMSRINTTIQIADTGIAPGSGVGNKRMELSEKTLGTPVIAIGVPTVVDAATMASDAIDLIIDNLMSLSKEGEDFYKMLNDIDKNEKYHLIKEVLEPYVGNLIVTPKEMDDIIDNLSSVIANGINMAVHPGIQLTDIDRYVN